MFEYSLFSPTQSQYSICPSATAATQTAETHKGYYSYQKVLCGLGSTK